MTELAAEIAAGVAIVSGAGAIAIMVVMMAVIHRQTVRIVALTQAIVDETVKLNRLLGQAPEARLLSDISRLGVPPSSPLAGDELDAALAHRQEARRRASADRDADNRRLTRGSV